MFCCGIIVAKKSTRALESKIGTYLRRIQGAHGGWPFFHDGAFDMSASVKAYFALKMIGDPVDAAHMQRAREAILARGGAASSNVFTRTLLALYGVVPWAACRSCRSRSRCYLPGFPSTSPRSRIGRERSSSRFWFCRRSKPKARNPKGVRIDELFAQPPAFLASRPKRRIRNGSGSSSSASSMPYSARLSRTFLHARANARSTRLWPS